MQNFTLQISFESNYHIGSGMGFAGLIDSLVVKNKDGLVYIPASTIKGKIKAQCKQIAQTLGIVICRGDENKSVCKTDLIDACLICRLFGSIYQEGKLIFNDCQIQKDDQEKILKFNMVDRFNQQHLETRYGVKISRRQKISEPNHFFLFESGNLNLTFESKIFSKINLIKDEKDLISNGIKLLTHIGGQKARGWGRIREISFMECQ